MQFTRLVTAVTLSMVALQHAGRRRLMALGGALAATGAGGVFAVAALAPDVAELPVQMVAEEPNVVQAAAVQPVGLLELPALYRSDVTRSTDTAQAALRRMGVADDNAAAFLRTDPLVRKHLWGRAGRLLRAETRVEPGAGHQMDRFTARWAADERTFHRLVVERTPAGSSSGWVSRLETAPLVPAHRLAGGVIQSSLFAATDEASIPDAVATQMADIFSGDIDFHRALRKGDRFSLMYEVLEADGEPLKAGRVVNAEFVNKGKAYSAIWFRSSDKPGGAYFTLAGASLTRSFLASPLEFSRVTSGFGMRTHPIARDWRAHKGVDYAAPTGTPIRSVANGVVAFAGVQRGYGNVVEVDHGKGKTTLYAHMNRIDVRKGDKISQGQHVGTVGRTGWSTGPHLHFEFRVDGSHRDPVAVLAQQVEEQPLSPTQKAQFAQVAAQAQTALAAAASLRLASAQ
ncbi:MAG: hypothetical protein RLZZ126_517 [Pseudomonadota bacterium]